MGTGIKTTIHKANRMDIPLLVRHHRRMFEEIVRSGSTAPKKMDWDALDQAYTHKLEDELGRQCTAWIIQAGHQAIASGAVTTLSMVPVPGDISHKVGFLHSLFTEPEYRKKGMANRILNYAIEHCHDRGMGRLMLNASKAGSRLYETMGFEWVDNAMRLWIKKF